MAEGTVKRIIEIDVKTGTEALTALRQLQQAANASEGSLKNISGSVKVLADRFREVKDPGDRFIQNLEKQIQLFGKGAKEVREYEASVLGVSRSAQPLINELDRLANAQSRIAEVQKANAAVEAGIASIENARISRGTTIVASLLQQRDALKFSADELKRFEAAAAGVLGQYDRLNAEIKVLTAEQAKKADADREAARTADEAAAAEKRYSDAGQQLLKTLRERNAEAGRPQDEISQFRAQAASSGVSGQAGPLIDNLALRKSLIDELARAEAEVTASQARAAAAEKQRVADGQALIDFYRQQIEYIGLTRKEQDLLAAQKLGVGTDVKSLQEDLERATIAHGKKADAAAEDARREREAEAADKAHSDAGQQLLATLRAQTEEYNKRANRVTPQQDIQAQGNALGVGPQVKQALDDQGVAKKLADDVASLNKVFEDNIAARQRAADAGRTMEQQLQREIDLFGKDAFAVREYDAALNGNLKQIQALNNILRDQQRIQEQANQKQREANELKREAASLKATGDTFIRQLEDEIATAGKGVRALREYRLEQLKASGAIDQKQFDFAKTLIPQLKEIEKNGHGAADALGGKAGMGRELLVLGHELSQGQFKRFGGSLLVLGEIAGAGKYLFSAYALAAGSVVAVLGFMAHAAIEGALAQDQFRKSLQLTNNFAGQTEGTFNELAQSIRKSGDVTIGVSTEILQALVSTGEFGPRTIGAIGLATADIARLTGKSGEDISKVFNGITKDTVAWATKTNEQYHFLTPTIFAHIKELQDQGRAEDATVVAANALHETLGRQKEVVGSVVSLWRDLKDAVSGAKHAIEDIGKTPTPEKLLEIAEKQLEDLRKPQVDALSKLDRNGKPVVSPYVHIDPEEERILISRVSALKRVIGEERRLALERADESKATQDLIETNKRLNDIENGLELGDKAIVKRTEYLRDYNLAIEANNKLSITERRPVAQTDSLEDRERVKKGLAVRGPAIRDADLAAIDKRYGNKPALQADNALDSIIRSLERENATVKDQIEQYKLLGDSVNHSAEAKLNAALKETPKGTGAGDAADEKKKDDARKLAREIDARQQELNARKELSDLAKQVKLLETEAAAVSKNAREKEAAALVGKVIDDAQFQSDTKLLAIRNQLLEVAKRSIELRADNKLLNTLREQNAQVDQEIKQLQTETSLIGLSTIERTKQLAVLKLEGEARKLIRDNPDKKDLINAEKAAEAKKLTDALQENYDEQRKFESGGKQAFAAYAEAAGDAGKYAESIIGNSLKGLEDSLFTFFKTGKLSFSSFFQSIADEFLRQQTKLLIKKFFDLDGVKDNALKAFGILKGQFFDSDEFKKQMNFLSTLKVDKGGESIDPNRARDAAAPGGKSLRQLEIEYANSDAAASVKTIGDDAKKNVDPAAKLLADAEASLRNETEALARSFASLRADFDRRGASVGGAGSTGGAASSFGGGGGSTGAANPDGFGNAEYDFGTAVPQSLPARNRSSTGKVGSAFFTTQEASILSNAPVPVRIANAEEFAKLDAQEKAELERAKSPQEREEVKALYARERDFAKKTGSFEPSTDQSSGGPSPFKSAFVDDRTDAQKLEPVTRVFESGLKAGLAKLGPGGQLASILVDPILKGLKTAALPSVGGALGVTGAANANDISAVRRLDNNIEKQTQLAEANKTDVDTATKLDSALEEQTASLEKIADAPLISGAPDSLPTPFANNVGFPSTSFASQGLAGGPLLSDTLAQADAAKDSADTLKGLANNGSDVSDTFDALSFAGGDSSDGLIKTAESALESSLGMGAAASSALTLSGALQTAAVSAASGSATSGLSGLGSLGSLFSSGGSGAGVAEAFIDYGLFVEKGGVVSAFNSYAEGGVHSSPRTLSGYSSYALGGVHDAKSIVTLYADGGVHDPKKDKDVVSMYADGGVHDPKKEREPLVAYARGGVHASPRSRITMYADGGYADTPFGRLKQERQSDGGGIARNARLAVFGEGRLPEAYIPMTDGKTVGIQIDRNGESYVPLSGGRKIPVSIKGDGFSPERKRRSGTARSFAYGGLSDEVGYFAQGGVGGGVTYYSAGGVAGFDASSAAGVNGAPPDGKPPVPATAGTASKQDITIDYSPTISIDSRSDQAQVLQLVQASVAQGQRQLLQHLKDTGAIR